MTLGTSNRQLAWLIQHVGKGDRYVPWDQQTGTQFGDYRVDGGVLTATGYSDYLSRMTIRITEAGSQHDRQRRQVQADQPVLDLAGVSAATRWLARHLHPLPSVRY
ncbi:MAG TPA: hypothetical protein VHN80_15220 [Kineosporiaceae bacterium]|nr:hypothetical protein [Kineosporiaceae bacterium]